MADPREVVVVRRSLYGEDAAPDRALLRELVRITARLVAAGLTYRRLVHRVGRDLLGVDAWPTRRSSVLTAMMAFALVNYARQHGEVIGRADADLVRRGGKVLGDRLAKRINPDAPEAAPAEPGAVRLTPPPEPRAGLGTKQVVVIVTRGAEYEEILLPAAKLIRVGRGYVAAAGQKHQSGLLARDEFISEPHCQFTRSDVPGESRWSVEDLGTTNGTYLVPTRERPNGFNSSPVVRSTPLGYGWGVRLGRTLVSVEERRVDPAGA